MDLEICLHEICKGKPSRGTALRYIKDRKIITITNEISERMFGKREFRCWISKCNFSVQTSMLLNCSGIIRVRESNERG